MIDYALPPVTPELKRLFRFRLNMPVISRKTGIPTNILGVMVRRGLVNKPKGVGYYYYCNHDYFEKIDTEQKAYWLGFLYADGCITDAGGVNLLLAGYEKPHLEKYRQALEAEHPIEERWDKIREKGKKERVQHSVKIRISSKKMSKDLLDKGCAPRKSLILEFPSFKQVPQKLLRHFIRGYFDGDGSIWNIEGTKKWGVSIIGTDKFVKQMLSKLVLDGGFNPAEISFRKHENYDKNGMMYLGIFSFEAMSRFREYIYKNATVWLDRKREKFNTLPQSRNVLQPVKAAIIRELQKGQRVMNTLEIFNAVKEEIPLMSRLTLNIAMKDLENSEIVKSLGRTGRRGFKKYVYNFEETGLIRDCG